MNAVGVGLGEWWMKACGVTARNSIEKDARGMRSYES